MSSKPYLVNFCDRCDDEIDRVEVLESGAIAPRAPDYFRQKKVEGADGSVTMEDRALAYLCKKCKKDVETLDARIFGGGRTRETIKEGTNAS